MKKIALLLCTTMLLSLLNPVFAVSDSQTSDYYNPFTDVGELGKNEKWFTEAVLWANTNGYMIGTSEGKFSPSLKMTRAQIVTVLSNSSGDDVQNYSGAFEDVKEGAWYAEGVQWAYNSKVTSGTSEYSFSPQNDLTREQLVKFLASYTQNVLGLDIIPASDSLPEVYTDRNKVSSWAKEYMIWALEKGVIKGTSATTLSPKAVATRAEMAQMLKNYSVNIAGGLNTEVMERRTALNMPVLQTEYEEVSTVYPDTLNITGQTGRLADNLIDAWMADMAEKYPEIMEIYRDREIGVDWKLFPWSGEFAGKYLTSAFYIYKLTRSQELYESCVEFIDELISYQGENGYLSCFSNSGAFNPDNNYMQSETWDAWSHYHVMTGLMLWYNLTADADYKAALLKMGDLFMDTFYGSNPQISEAMGNAEQNLAAYHIFVQLYEMTEDQKYLDYAKLIEADMPNSGDYLNLSLAGKDFYQSSKPRWEAIHTVLGIAEMYHATGDEMYKNCASQIAHSILRTDVHNTGGFSTGEMAIGTPFYDWGIETCCSVAYNAYTSLVYTITGDTVLLDQMERAHYNAILGAHSTDGTWATYDTPMEGFRNPNPNQGSVILNCCGVNSPRGVGQVTDWMFTESDGVLSINFYENMEATFGEMALKVESNYPAPGTIKMTVTDINQPIAVRIPGWSNQTVITVGDQKYYPESGTTFTIPESYSSKDLVILIDFDYTVYFGEGGDSYAGEECIYVGPILYGADNANNPDAEIFHDEGGDYFPEITVEMLNSSSPVLCEDGVIRWQVSDEVILCDFYHLGANNTEYRTWFHVNGR